MNKLIVSCLAAAVLLTSGCGAIQRANEARAQREFAQEMRIWEQMSPEQRRQAQQDQYAQEFCANQGTMTAVTARGGFITTAFVGSEVQWSCHDFYQRTGHLPGQTF